MTKNAMEKKVAELEAQLAEFKVREERQVAMNGVKIAYAEGLTKQGKVWRNVSVSGGVMGWPGVKLTPAKWQRLLALRVDIDEVMAKHAPNFQSDAPSATTPPSIHTR